MAITARALTLLAGIAERKGLTLSGDRLPVRDAVTTVARQTLSFLDWHNDGAPLILLHGGSLTAHTWDFVCLDLARDFHCVALDLRGHGDSGDAEDYTIQASVNDVLELADHFDWDRFHLAGMSLGGNIAFHFTAQHLSRVRSLTMIDVGPGVNFGATEGMRSFVAKSSEVNSIDEIVDSVMRFRPQSDRDVVEYRYLHLMRQLPSGGYSWKRDRRRPIDFAHILSMIEAMPASAASMHCPVLIARGSHSSIFSLQKAMDFAAMFPHGSCAEIPNAGHNIQEDSPSELAAAMRTVMSQSAS